MARYVAMGEDQVNILGGDVYLSIVVYFFKCLLGVHQGAGV